MYLERLYASHFRNLEELDWRPHRHFNLLTGANGQGKTNVLEALFVIAGLRSFRATRLAECIQFGENTATLAATYRRRGDRGDLGLQVQTKGRKTTVDGKAVSSAVDYLGKLVVVLFAPADLALPHAQPADRRRWLDRVVFNHEPQHLLELRDYEKVLTSRNVILKQGQRGSIDPHLIDVYDALLVRHGAAVIRRRLAVLARFAPIVSDVFAAIAAPGLHLDVVCPGRQDDGQLEQKLLELLRECRQRDQILGYTTRGPHRDDVQFLLQGRPAAVHASQGQCRALVLALKIAEIRSLEATLGEPPVLLMDDVSSELDQQRNAALMRYLDDLGGQVILTTTASDHIRARAPRQIFSMFQGQLQPGALFERQEIPPGEAADEPISH